MTYNELLANLKNKSVNHQKAKNIARKKKRK